MCRFPVDFKGKKKIAAGRFHPTTVCTVLKFIVQICFLEFTCISNLSQGDAISNEVSVSHEQWAYSVSIRKHCLPLGGGRSKSLGRMRLGAAVCMLSALHPGLCGFFPLLHSPDLPPRKLTSYFNDLHPNIKEMYISSLNLN